MTDRLLLYVVTTNIPSPFGPFAFSLLVKYAPEFSRYTGQLGLSKFFLAKNASECRFSETVSIKSKDQYDVL